MKITQFSFLVVFLFFSCNLKKDFNTRSLTNKYSSVQQKADRFEQSLSSKKMDADYIVNVSSDTIQFENFIIRSIQHNNHLNIIVNNDTIKPFTHTTLNDVWASKETVDYVNMMRQIKYYKETNLLLFQLHFYPCIGLGCGVNYQLVYDVSTKNIYAFGRFRTGDDMDLYYFKNEYPFYLSKSFKGRNSENRDTITYELYKIEKNNAFNISDSILKNKAIFTYHNDTLTDFKLEGLEY